MHRVVAAARLATATVLGPGGTPPATAAGCSGAGGVTVVVDHHQLGGGIQQACDADGGGKLASTVFPDSGFPLTYVQRQPGFVCRVAGVPSSDPCVNTPPATAYWSLWWSDGTSGDWVYSSQGVGSLRVPDGGYVAFSWQGQDGKAAPGVAPRPRGQTSPPASGGTGGTGDSSGGSGGSGGAGGGGADPTAPAGGAPATGPDDPSSSPRPGKRSSGASTAPSASGSPRASAGGEATASASSDPTGGVSTDSPPSGGSEPADQAADGTGDRLPAWLSLLVVATLAGVGGTVAVVRARRAGP